MYKEDGDKLIVYIPKCPCGRHMKQYGRRGAGFRATANEVASPLSMSPSITWTNITFNCAKHPSVGYQFGVEDLVKINQYPEANIIFKNDDMISSS